MPTVHKTDEVREKALELVALHIGDITAQMYSQLFAKKSDAFILKSVHSLLLGLLGEKKTHQEFARLHLKTSSHDE